MPHKVLSILLRGVDDIVAFTCHARMPGEVFDIREEAAPLRLEQIDDVQVFRLRFEVAALRREEVDVRVAGIPPALIHVDPALETQLKLLLSRGDLDLGTERLVFVAAGRINDHFALWKPALRRAIDVGVTDLTKPGVAADINVPGIEIGVDLVVMAMRLIRHTVGRSEVDAARNDLPGLVVDHAHLHPVLAWFRQRNVNLVGFDGSFVLNLSPLNAIDLLSFLSNFNRCRWHA